MRLEIDTGKLQEALDALPKDSWGNYLSMSFGNMMAAGSSEFPVWAKKVSGPAREEDRSAAETEETAFGMFWKMYPARCGVKGAKAPARVAFHKLVKGLSPAQIWNLFNDIEHALSWQKQTEQWKEANGKYIPMPATYLNQRRFEDERPVEAKKERYQDMNGIWREK